MKAEAGIPANKHSLQPLVGRVTSGTRVAQYNNDFDKTILETKRERIPIIECAFQIFENDIHFLRLHNRRDQ
jgi:hypothetical protein